MAESVSGADHRVPLDEEALEGADRVEIMAALFENFVAQQGGLCLSLLGELDSERSSGSETSISEGDLEAAKHVVDQLEMIEFKTHGNLTPDEAAHLRKTITVLGEALLRKLGDKA